MSQNNSNVTVSGGFIGGLARTLGIVFIVLKLADVIDWSWWWVLAPFWIPFTFSLLFAIVVALVLAGRRR